MFCEQMCCWGPHRSSVSSLEDSSEWVSFFSPLLFKQSCRITPSAEGTLSIFHSCRLDVLCRTEGCVAVSTTQASVTRVHRDGLEHRKKLFLVLFPRKKTAHKNAEKPQGNQDGCVSSWRNSAYLCHHLSDVFAACRSKTCGHVFTRRMQTRSY